MVTRTFTKQLNDIVNIDPLSNMLNRRGFLEIIKSRVALCERHHRAWSLLLLDIDHFKKVNDHFGHEVGDQVIISISNLIHKSIRECDYAARWGGEEFLVFLPEAGIKQCEAVGHRIRQAVEQSEHSSEKIHVTISGGVAVNSHGFNFDKTLCLADQELYKAKSNGRNRIEIKEMNKYLVANQLSGHAL